MAVTLPDSFTAEDFESWLPVAQALATLATYWDHHTARDTLLTNLKHGLLDARAEVSICRGDRREYALVPPLAWEEEPHYQSPFWDHGDLQRELGTYQARRMFQFIRIRFDPVGFQKLVPSTANSVPSEQENEPPGVTTCQLPDTREKPALSDARLEAWALLFNDANPGASEAAAQRSVLFTFPNSHVTRERLRRVLPNRPQGRPLKKLD